MDRRNTAPEASGFLKDLESEGEEYNDMIELDGKIYRVPYKIVKEITFSDLNTNDLKDIPYSARLQYRLLLLDSVLKAKVEFIRNRITVTYNPPDAKNRKEKISREDLVQFIEKEGVIINKSGITERDVDYVEEIYKYQFEPATIREHAPYGYSLGEWKKIKPEWKKKQAEAIKNKYNKFRSWQNSYLEQHTELSSKYDYKPNQDVQQEKPSLISRLVGKGKDGKDKGFWFHGV